MSLVNRIELSNFFDKTGGSEWNPTYRHNVLDLRGQNTAIVLMNGSGKTTITTAIKNEGVKFSAVAKNNNHDKILLFVAYDKKEEEQNG